MIVRVTELHAGTSKFAHEIAAADSSEKISPGDTCVQLLEDTAVTGPNQNEDTLRTSEYERQMNIKSF
jgi:hypothetical protein